MTVQEVFDFNKIEKLDWSDFVESRENYGAVSYLTKWPDWSSNGLIITGNHGVGKSHLAALWGQSANAVYVLKNSLGFNPRDLFDNDCNFIIDNFRNFLEDQDWLFHFYNIAKEKNRFFLILDVLPPKQWNISLADLNSRIMTLPVINIPDHSDELLFKVIKKLLRDYDMSISDETIEYILETSERNISHISYVLKTLDKLALQQKKNVNVSFVKKYLQG